MPWIPVDAVTERPIHFSANDWPILIHGAPKQGASHFTVMLAADFVRHGKPIVFMCAKGEAIRSLQKELNLGRPAVRTDTITPKVEMALEQSTLITFFKRKGVHFHHELAALADWRERIIFIKNVEETLTPELWALVQSHPRFILSGNVNELTTPIDPRAFPTTILFSTISESWPHQRQPLPTYIGDMYQPGKHVRTILLDTAR